MSTRLEYRGYKTAITYSEPDDTWHGKLELPSDLVSFEGSSIMEVVRDFKDAVDDYIAVCEQVHKARTYAKHKIKPYRSSITWADNELAQQFKSILDTEGCRRYAGRRIFRIQNRYKIRIIMAAAKFYA
jgi:predicted HicB family RNase H-like nuclease